MDSRSVKMSFEVREMSPGHWEAGAFLRSSVSPESFTVAWGEGHSPATAIERAEDNAWKALEELQRG